MFLFFIIVCVACNDTEAFLEEKYKEAFALYESKNYSQAVEILDKVLSLDHGHSETLARAYFLRGIVHYIEDRSQLAYKDYMHAMMSFDAIGNEKMVASTFNYLGQIFYERELFDQAHYYFNLALHHTHASSKKYKGFFHFGVAKSLAKLGKFDQALDHYLKANKIQEEIKNYNDLVKIEVGLGILHSVNENYNQSLVHYQTVMDLAHLTNDPELYLWKANNNIGNTFLRKGELARAEEYFLKALDYQSNDSQYAITYNDLGKVHNKREEYKKAWVCFKKSIDANDKKIELNEVAITNEGMKKIFYALNQPDSMLRYALIINDLTISLIQDKNWLEFEESKRALFMKHQNYINEQTETKHYTQISWMMALIGGIIFLTVFLAIERLRIYNYKSLKKGHNLIKNTNEAAYLLDMFMGEKEELKKMIRWQQEADNKMQTQPSFLRFCFPLNQTLLRVSKQRFTKK